MEVARRTVRLTPLNEMAEDDALHERAPARIRTRPRGRSDVDTPCRKYGVRAAPPPREGRAFVLSGYRDPPGFFSAPGFLPAAVAVIRRVAPAVRKADKSAAQTISIACWMP